MKERIINALDNITKAQSMMAINDMLGLSTVEELQELQKYSGFS